MYGVRTLSGNEDTLIKVYEEQNQAIIAHFANRPGKLLVLDLPAGEGWYELVSFLGPKGVPPFPHANSRAAGNTRLGNIAKRKERTAKKEAGQ